MPPRSTSSCGARRPRSLREIGGEVAGRCRTSAGARRRPRAQTARDVRGGRLAGGQSGGQHEPQEQTPASRSSNSHGLNVKAAGARSYQPDALRRVQGVSRRPPARPAALGGDERADLGERPRVEHVPRLDPAAPGGPDAEPHLPVEQRRRGGSRCRSSASRRRRPRARARSPSRSRCDGRAVDLERSAGLDRGRVTAGRSPGRSPAVRPTSRLAGWVITVTSGCRIAPMQRRVSRVASWPAASWSDARTMSRRSRTASSKSRRAVGQDVDLDAVQDGHARVSLADARDLVALSRERRRPSACATRRRAPSDR